MLAGNIFLQRLRLATFVHVGSVRGNTPATGSWGAGHRRAEHNSRRESFVHITQVQYMVHTVPPCVRTWARAASSFEDTDVPPEPAPLLPLPLPLPPALEAPLRGS